MKKGASIFLAIIILTAFPWRADAKGLKSWCRALSLSYSGDILTQIDDGGVGNDYLLGIGLNDPSSLYANGIYFIIEPMVSAEYGVFSNLLRIRTGALFGRLHPGLPSFGYHAGLSGALAIDFANDAVAVGISPMIGVDLWFFFFCGIRLRFQYDFYTIERYNRFVITDLMLIRITG